MYSYEDRMRAVQLLAGVDQFQINGIRVKYWEPDESFVRSYKAVSTQLFSESDVVLPVVGSLSFCHLAIKRDGELRVRLLAPFRQPWPTVPSRFNSKPPLLRAT
ncbi:Ribulose bisphosphate carboxylase large chain, catalytic domain [Ensifer sp. YR511]|nr:Ribulose bisphosphate carboxylase large chain, catalytic domain [Ensifer sp. YR511]